MIFRFPNGFDNDDEGIHASLLRYLQAELGTLFGGAENRPIRKIVPKGKKENAPIFQNSKKWNRKIVPKLKN